MILVFNTEFPVNKNSQREFPSFQGGCSVLTQLCQISMVSLHFFWACLQNYSRHFCLFRIFYFSGGTVLFCYRPCERPTTPAPMPSKQYFTQLIGFLLYMIIELFQTFLSLQNILHRQGNKSLFTWRVFLPPKGNLVRFKQYCIVLLSSFLYTLLEKLEDIFRLF